MNDGLRWVHVSFVDVFGTELRDEFVRYKRAEWDEYHQSISQWEVDRYARFF